MVQYNIKRSKNIRPADEVYDVVMNADQYGNIITPGPTSVSAFDEPIAVTLTPVIQLDGVYELYADQFQTFISGGGSVGVEDSSMWYASCSTTAYSYGVVRSRRHLRYRPGQGALARFTALFDGSADGLSLRAGLGNQESAMVVGVNNGRFGIMRSDGVARAEIRTLTISGTASTGNATIVLNGTSFVVELVNGENAYQTAARIARATFTGWIVEQKDLDVRFLSTLTASLNGTYSYTGTTTTGTFVRSQAGAAIEESWIYQEDFNVDTLDGKGPSRMVIDPSKLNVYQINFRWLGAGVAKFCIEDNRTGKMLNFHNIIYSNSATRPWTHNPNYKLTYVAYNTGGSTAGTVKGASAMAAIEGDVQKNDYTRSYSIQKSSLSSGSIHQVFAVRNPITLNGKINTREIRLQDISVASQGNDPIQVMIFYLPSALATGNQIWYRQADVVANISTETATLSLTSNTPVVTFVAGINGSAQYDLTPYRVVISPGDNAVVAVKSGQSISQIAAALTWIAD